jgi:hypothetical protein
MEKAGISRRRPVKETLKPQGFDPAAFLMDE